MNSSERLHRLLGGSELAPLRERLRSRFEGKEVVASLQLSGLNEVERAALAQLAGKPASKARSMTIDVRAVDETLSLSGVAASFRDALERLDGPIVDRSAEREQLRAHWGQVMRGCDNEALRAWLDKAANLGLLKRLSGSDASRATSVLARAASVMRRLPCGGIPRAQLAAEALGDAHGLDSRQAVATIVLSAIRANRDFEGPADEAEDGRDRSVWASVGVLVNELARPALCLNLPVLKAQDSGAPLGRPFFFSLRDLVRSPPFWQVSGRTVFVCENPNVVAMAADQLGAGCAPLVCTDGMPAAAQRVLLGQLVDAGAELVYHGDFDWPGLAIASNVIKLFSARPWRMSSQDYARAVELAVERVPLSPFAVDSAWDESLAQAMKQLGVAVPEEAVFAGLARDLGHEADVHV